MLKIDATLIIQIINLIVLYFVVKRFLYNPLAKVIEERQNTIIHHITEAEQVRDEALATKKEYEEVLIRVKDEGSKILRAYQEEAERIKANIIQEGRQEAKRIIESAYSEIEANKVIAYQEVRANAARIAVDLSGKILTECLDKNSQAEIARYLISKVMTKGE